MDQEEGVRVLSPHSRDRHAQHRIPQLVHSQNRQGMTYRIDGPTPAIEGRVHQMKKIAREYRILLNQIAQNGE